MGSTGFNRTLVALGWLLLGLLAPTAIAQSVPASGPLRIVVGFPPGGGADQQARLVAEKLRQELGVVVIVDNRAGAGGRLAAEYVRHAPADGQTVLFANTHMMVMVPLTSRAVRYEPLKDFSAIGGVSNSQMAIVVPSGSATSLAAWLEEARTDPKKASYGVPSSGSVAAFIGFRLGAVASSALLPVPYRGAIPLVQDLLGGQIAAAITPTGDLIQHHKAGRLKVLAVNGAHRAPALPDVPTLSELGFPGFESLEWNGLFARAGTPDALASRLQASLLKALDSAEVREKLSKLGALPNPSAGPVLQKQMTDDWALWAPVIKASGFRSD